MTSKLTRERIEQYANDPRMCNINDEIREMARMVLAAMGDEPHTEDELSNLLWYSQEATCHSDPNYYCEFQRLATPGFIAWIIRELQERRKADSEPVAVTDDMAYEFHHALTDSMIGSDDVEEIKTGLRAVFANLTAPVVSDKCPERLPCSVLLEPGLRFGKGIKTSTVLSALARRAVYESEMSALSPEEKAEFQAKIADFKAMLAAAPQPQNAPQNIPEIIPGWIPVSEHLPKEKGVYQVWNGKYVDNVPFWFGSFQSLHSELITHWMPLPAAPQEVLDGQR